MAAKIAGSTFQTNAVLGLGEAIQRLIRVEIMHSSGFGGVPKDLGEEAKLITEALNQQFQLDLGFDCNMDGVPDTIEIFMKTAQTSCCRILPMADKSEATGKRTGSRSQKTKTKRAPRKK